METVPKLPVQEIPSTSTRSLWYTVTLPTEPVTLRPVTETFASPSTSTETAPRVPTIVGRTAMACALTATTGVAVVPATPDTDTLAAASTVGVPNALVPT